MTVSIKKYTNGKPTLFTCKLFKDKGNIVLDTECINELDGQIYPTNSFKKEFDQELKKQKLLLTQSQIDSLQERYIYF